jgi:hypothetical protein
MFGTVFSCADFFKWKLECFGGVVLKRVAYNSDHFLASFVLSLPSFHVRWQWRSAATQLSATVEKMMLLFGVLRPGCAFIDISFQSCGVCSYICHGGDHSK